MASISLPPKKLLALMELSRTPSVIEIYLMATNLPLPLPPSILQASVFISSLPITGWQFNTISFKNRRFQQLITYDNVPYICDISFNLSDFTPVEAYLHKSRYSIDGPFFQLPDNDKFHPTPHPLHSTKHSTYYPFLYNKFEAKLTFLQITARHLCTASTPPPTDYMARATLLSKTVEPLTLGFCPLATPMTLKILTSTYLAGALSIGATTLCLLAMVSYMGSLPYPLWLSCISNFTLPPHRWKPSVTT